MWVEVVRRCGRPPTWVRLVAGEASALPAGRCGSRGSPSPAACPGVPGSAQRAEPPRHWRARSRRGHPRRHEPVSGGKARRPLPTRPLSACRPEEEARRRPRPGREEAWPARARPRQCARRAFRIRPSVRVSDRPSSLSARPRQDRSLALGYPEVPSCRPATLSARRDWSGPHHGLGSRRELHPAPTHPPTALVRAPCDHRGLPRPPAGPPGLHSAVASAARAAGEPWPCPRSPLWLLATRRGLVCRSHQDASGEEVQQCPVWRSDRLSLLLPAVPLGTSHGGCLRLSREAPGDAAVSGRSGHLVCRVGGLKELRRLPGLQGDWGHQQGKRQPLHSHRSRPGLTFRPQPRHGSHWSGLLAGLHAGPHAWRLPASGDGTLAGFALCCLRPVVYFLLPAGDAACGEAGILYRPGVPGRGRPAQPRGPAPFLGRGPWPGPTRWRRDPSPSPPGSGVLPLPLPVLGSRVHPELPRSSALPVQQPAAREDVFLHRPHHGHRAGRLRPEDQPWQRDCRGEAGHLAAGACLPPHWLGAHAARAGPGAAALLLRPPRWEETSKHPTASSPPLPQRLAQAEGHDHGHTSEPGRPGQGSGTHGGCLRHTVSATPPNDKIKQLFYTKCLSPAHGCASLPPTWETPEHQKLLRLH
ncbi:major facilitator superfamily domain-containing protein 10 isoform X6 [Felis catus]|uniref:major facilitator superfamily domain-containing protein 10 isoform X6 n=1 Tax=Felis catus TaxID=9685 RepID=UPI001D19AE86|nr:major facilitator superfamily domain-containing protein 10 isoform X6 [Felis catus]